MDLLNSEFQATAKALIYPISHRQTDLPSDAAVSSLPVMQPEEEPITASFPREASKKELGKTATVISGIIESQWLKVALVVLVILFLITGILSHFGTGGQKLVESGHVKSSPKSEWEGFDGPNAPAVKASETSSKISAGFSGGERAEPEAFSKRNANDDDSPTENGKPESNPAPNDQPKLEEAHADASSRQFETVRPVSEEIPFSLDAKASETGSVSYPYSILLDTFKTSVDAEASRKAFASNGVSAYLAPVDLGTSGVWFRLFTGYFETPRQAEAVITEKNLKGALIKKTEYAGLIESSPSNEAIAGKMTSLLKSGLSPYVIREENGNSKLYVGAFYTKSGADSLCSGISDRGVSCQAVKR